MWSEVGVVSRYHGWQARVRPGEKFRFYSKGSGKSLVCFRQRWGKADMIRSPSLQHSDAGCMDNVFEGGTEWR